MIVTEAKHLARQRTYVYLLLLVNNRVTSSKIARDSQQDFQVLWHVLTSCFCQELFRARFFEAALLAKRKGESRGILMPFDDSRRPHTVTTVHTDVTRWTSAWF